MTRETKGWIAVAAGWAGVAVLLGIWVFVLASAQASAQETSGIDLAPIDVPTIIEKVGGWAVVAILLAKIIFNDMAHMNRQLTEISKDIKLLVRLTAKVAGKDPDVMEAQADGDGTQQ